MNIDFVTLNCFVHLAETKNFTKTAQRVGRTQSAVSQQIAKLEAIFEKPLLRRDAGLSLTTEGEIFLTYAKRLLAISTEMMDHLKDPDIEGEVRFGLPEDFASVFLGDVLSKFIAIHPRVQLHVETDLTLNLLDRYKNNDFDLVLVKDDDISQFPEGVDIWTEQLVWVGHRDLVDLSKPLPLVLSPAPCVYRKRALKTLDASGLRWRISFSSHSYASMAAAVKAKMGLTALPRNMVPEELKKHIHLSSKLPKLEDTHISLLKKNEGRSPSLNSFEKFVLDQLRAR